MKILLRALASVYLFAALFLALAGLVGFAFSASQGEVAALGMLIVFFMGVALLILAAREAWKDSTQRSWFQYVTIFIPMVLLIVFLSLESTGLGFSS